MGYLEPLTTKAPPLTLEEQKKVEHLKIHDKAMWGHLNNTCKDEHIIYLIFRTPELNSQLTPKERCSLAKQDILAAILLCATSELQIGIDSIQLIEIALTDYRAALELVKQDGAQTRFGRFWFNKLTTLVDDNNPTALSAGIIISKPNEQIRFKKVIVVADSTEQTTNRPCCRLM